ncbi:hypothetical protein ABVN80_14660 [Acinetobacter baumannii]
MTHLNWRHKSQTEPARANLKNRTSIKKNDDGAEDKTAAKAKNPQGNKAAKATKNNRQGQVTEQTK